MPALFTFPNRILFGEGARLELLRELSALRASRPLVVTDRGIVSAGLIGEFEPPIQESPRFADVQANPTEDDVEAGLASFHGHECDALVAIGGGSAIDAAKAIRLLAGHGGSLADYDLTTGGLDRITPAMPPMIAVPTTAGTGSEAGRGALIQMRESGRKAIVLSPFLLPSVSICDPELTYGLTPAMTAGTGMDAFTHAIESYLSTTVHPICDGIALEALRYVARGLESSVQDGRNIRARRDLMMGALMAGISFHKGLGVVHSLSHALGSVGRVHHGTLNAILLPACLKFNRQGCEARMADLASVLGLGRSRDGAAHLAVLSELMLARLPLPKRLGDLDGLNRDRLPEYARLAMLDHCHRTNPRPCTAEDMVAMLESAW